MRENEMPVTVSVTRADGTVEQVQIGTAVRRGDGFSVRLAELTIGGEGVVRAAAPARRAPAAGPGEPPTVFPPYGRSRGMPIRGASAQDLDFYATGARRTLADPGKARFHDKERALLGAIEAEQARQSGGGGTEEEPPSPEEEQF
ncbi:MAG TPA: hypothetical protein VMT11_04890 [Myxococcaceae bacterium]|nr:hypothetical protein [Myxococcaceae bacterium]